MNHRRNVCHYKPVAGYQLENSTALVTIITIDFTVHLSHEKSRCHKELIALQYFVLLSFVAVMLTQVLMIIINHSTITLCNFYYNYYYRRVFAYYYYYYVHWFSGYLLLLLLLLHCIK